MPALHPTQMPQMGGSYSMDGKGDDRRSHHNALERKRRDNIKDSFSMLRDSIPMMIGEKVHQISVQDVWDISMKWSAARYHEIYDDTYVSEILIECHTYRS